MRAVWAEDAYTGSLAHIYRITIYMAGKLARRVPHYESQNPTFE